MLLFYQSNKTGIFIVTKLLKKLKKELYCGTSSKNYIAACSSSSLHALTGFDFSPKSISGPSYELREEISVQRNDDGIDCISKEYYIYLLLLLYLSLFINYF